jgi:hypothetical protein
MKNIPNKIYLQVGLEEEFSVEDFNSLERDFVTWESNQIYSDDLQFISVDFILARIKELENKKFNTTTKDGLYNFNITSSVISELKNLIK